MAIINFAVPETLEKRINKTIKEKGFASKAEFFRFAAVHFLDIVQKPFATEDERFNFLSATLQHEITHGHKGKTLPNIKTQLEDV
ncbi:hypothetical protein A3E39_01775 [Candidatus Uhrbacteria bacterium RIFCSPHIGHO2_12_FULL_60_25]|uniref:Ribbon-helix-helix protein CopG domain-containing protein n=1 Tax=Candidatus Uhrbacteria bacterium RIFCSPHIGHO2_12_FULL_60_25 TaxID=1802399 RepID=A0A1F7UPV6_9BACT|nr:MAG: hypothetical protein A3D73_04185 [Candidatus Uhrbacteria bacterium RIFCSPHIGHO2_02_FULL_60_44]OGL79738.1 MAG: hypothetical protein A3E39_01775 [Candidatus Uhrbacteria bacterium RIFCSPHIGHO2_12_FULL_60_25]